MALTGAHAPGATPLSEEDLEGLRIPSVKAHGELNEVEAANIIRGQEWALRTRSARLPDMLSDSFLRRLHQAMFGGVWTWAGEYRGRDTNIGVPFHQIREHLHNAFADARTWLEHSTYSPEEFAVRLHYRIVTVHPFRNGNGRHARMMADVTLVRHFNRPPLPWGNSPLRAADTVRQAYIDALVAADHHDFRPLLAFAMSPGPS
jgi:Fic-DOC domain mobile mystery protein B